MTWSQFLTEEQDKVYYKKLMEKIQTDKDNGHIIFPSNAQIFNAFKLTPFEDVKVIIVGQDPYYNKGQAMGLSFSVPDGVVIPPSLKNIFKEIEDDLGIECYNTGNLMRWAEQGVFLLNTTLTVRAGNPNSHENYGWKSLTSRALGELDRDSTPKVFMLWGKNARDLKFIFKNPEHLVLEAVHPSPLSAYRGFFGCKHFSKANEFLVKNEREPIDWR